MIFLFGEFIYQKAPYFLGSRVSSPKVRDHLWAQTWNDEITRNPLKPKGEKAKIQTYLNGWSDKSKNHWIKSKDLWAIGWSVFFQSNADGNHKWKPAKHGPGVRCFGGEYKLTLKLPSNVPNRTSVQANAMHKKTCKTFQPAASETSCMGDRCGRCSRTFAATRQSQDAYCTYKKA